MSRPSQRRSTTAARVVRILALVLATGLAGCGEGTVVASGDGSTASDAVIDACQGAGCVQLCSSLPDGAPCDDGEPCTASDACQGGVCSGTSVCACLADADCAGQEDGDRCNGTLFCDTSVAGHACKVAPATVVQCPDEGFACQHSQCQPATGSCALAPLAVGTACDDGNPCTPDDGCDGAGTCAGGASTCACQSDADCADRQPANLCQARLYCDKGSHTCKPNPATLVVCPAATQPCTQVLCQPTSGTCLAQTVPEGSACSDGKECTVGDICVASQCKPGVWTCPCTQDADCQGQDDGDLCNGLPYCDLTTGACKPNPATVVSCPSVNDTACRANLCAPKTGQCALTAIAEGKPCDDGSACSKGESCQQGQCGGGVTTCSCASDADCAAKEDGNVCNGTLYCDVKSGTCQVNPATVIHCPPPPDPGCASVSCQPTSGLCLTEAAKSGKPCNDGSACTVGDACDGKGGCVSGQTLVCPCTTDAHCAAFDDGNPCNGTYYCQKPLEPGKPPACVINPATVIACPDAAEGACLIPTCQPATAACSDVPLADGSACSDGDPCTGGDGCTGGKCLGLPVVCNDGDPCTTDACKATAGGCVFAAKPCEDGNPCTSDACDSATGACQHPPLAGPCDDGDACTSADACASGACKGTPQPCSDGNGCTIDSCAGGVCAHKGLDGDPCDDGDACSAPDSCAQGSCVSLPQAASACADDKPCTFDTCHAKVGCLHLWAIGAPCDDGDACTVGDACQAGGCVGLAAAATACDDGNPCTSDGCQPGGGGCTHTPLPGACDDGDPCTGDDACAAGSCKGGKAVGCECAKDADCAAKDDGNLCNGVLRCDTGKLPYTCKLDPTSIVACPAGDAACAANVCEPATGACVSVAKAEGAACAPGGDLCKVGVCAKGACAAQGAKDCGDGKACTADTCDPKLGCLHNPAVLQGSPCDDGDPCTSGDLCALGACQGGKAKDCGDGNDCTLDICDAAAGCQHVAVLLDGLPCSDGDACSAGAQCLMGFCAGGKAKDCDDGKVCTADSCSKAGGGAVPPGGCVYAPAAGACDDGNPCTESDACKSGTCAGKAVVCNDKNSCTVDTCQPGIGCVHDAKPLEGKLCVHPAGCVVGAVCAQGSCSGGDASACTNTGDCSVQKDALYLVHGPTVSSATVTWGPDGDAWISSYQGTAPLKWMVARMDGFAVQKSLWSIAVTGTAATAQPVLVPLADGGVILASGANAKSGDAWQEWKSQLRRLDANGDAVWSNPFGQVDGQATAGLLRKDGTILVNFAPDSTGRATQVACTAAGAKLWSVARKGPSGTYYQDGYAISSMIELPGKDIVLFGRRSNPSTATSTVGQFMMLRLDAAGQLQWVQYVAEGYDARLTSGGELSTGVLVALGYSRATADAVNQPWLLRSTSKGALLSKTKLFTATTHTYPGALALAGDDLVFTDYRQRPAPGSGTIARLSRRRSDGTFLWQRDYDVKDTNVLGSILPTTHGWLVGGYTAKSTPTGPAYTSLLLRTDSWGHAPCSAAGKCLGKTEASCDDGVACTVDSCEASKGCTHKACP